MTKDMDRLEQERKGYRIKELGNNPLVKKCTKCGAYKLLHEFHKNIRNKSCGLHPDCKVCHNERTRKHYILWYRTFDGYTVDAYNCMRKRSRSTIKKYCHTSLDTLCDRDLFLAKCKNSLLWKLLFDNWVLSDYWIRLAPSVDRIDSTKGYLLDNIQFMTQSANSSKGNKDRANRKQTAQIAVYSILNN